MKESFLLYRYNEVMGSTPLTPAMDLYGEKSMKEALIFLVFSSFAIVKTDLLHSISGVYSISTHQIW